MVIKNHKISNEKSSMSKIDEIKEILSTLRVFFSIASVIFVTVSTGVITMYKIKEFNILFWLGLLTVFIFLLITIILGLRINKKTKEIGEY